jgi:DNA-binding Lrp family transcriptional regulator
MPKVPEHIRKAYEDVRRDNPFFISLKVIGNRYYLYKQTTEWDRDRKRQKIITEYLGKITRDGRFIRKASGSNRELSKATAVIEAYGGRVVLPENSAEKRIQHSEQGLNSTDERILTILSMNAHADLSYFGRQLGLSAPAIYSRVRHLESRYGIRYLAEIDPRKLGYLTYLILVKFAEKPHSIEKLREELASEPTLQLALLTQGRYDLVMYAIVENNDEARTRIYEMRERIMPGHDSEWYVVPFYTTYNFVPFREEFFNILTEAVWRRTKGKAKKLATQITQKEYIVLKELNNNGIAKFAEIDKKHRFVGEGSGYIYRRLIDNGILKRVTISMQKLPIKYLAVFLSDKVNQNKYAASREDTLKDIIEDIGMPTNKYALVGDKWTPTGVVFVAPIYEEKNLESIEERLGKNNNGMKLDMLMVTDVLIGSLCFRRFDNEHSNQSELLIKEYGRKRAIKINYEKTDRGKEIVLHGHEKHSEEEI